MCRGKWRFTALSSSLAVFSVLISTTTYAFDSTAPAHVYAINPQVTPAISLATLERLADSPYLTGGFINIVDGRYCSGCNHSLADRTQSNDFIYDPAQPEFGEVMAYHHMDRYRDYVVGTLGLSLPSSALRVDVHAMDGGTPLLGAFYYPPVPFPPSPERIEVGDRNRIDQDGDWIQETTIDVDMAQNADVVVHEYGHWVTDQVAGMSYAALPTFLKEGWADYLAASFLGLDKIGAWTDRDSFRGYRRSLRAGVSDLDLWPLTNLRAGDGITNGDYQNARNYYNSMAWSSGLWELRERVARLISQNGAPLYPDGAVLADRLVLRGIQQFVDSNGATEDPAIEVQDGVAALKVALAQLQSLASSDPQYDARYANITANDIDLAFSSRYPLEYAWLPGGDGNQDVYTESADGRERAWRRQVGRRDVPVAVLDTGLLTGADLWKYFGSEDANFDGQLGVGEVDHSGNGLDTGNIFVNSAEIPGDGIDNDNNGLIDDVSGWDFVDEDQASTDPRGLFGFEPHGESVARYLAELGDNGRDDSAGIAWSGAIMPVRVASATGSVLPWAHVNFHETQGISYAGRMGVPLVNFSRGFFEEADVGQQSGALDDPAAALHMPGFEAIQMARPEGADRPMLMMVAAGNEGRDLDQLPVFPAAYPLPNIVSVAATEGGQLVESSDYGRYSVDLAAQGGQTSYATPIVSGALALLLSEEADRREAHPGYRRLTIGEMRYLLLMSVDRLQSLEGMVLSGGRLNIDRLLQFYEDDADWDGYAASIEALFGTNPQDAASHPDMDGDSDGDGLSNALELAYGTIPVNVSQGEIYSSRLYPVYLNADGTLRAGVSAQDSDGDGTGDLAETRPVNGYMTDPVNPDSDADGLVDGSDTQPTLIRMPLTNAAVGGAATASSLFFGRQAQEAIDGDEATYWQSGFGVSAPHTLSVDMGREAIVYNVGFIGGGGYAIPAQYRIQLSRNGTFAGSDLVEVAVAGNTQAVRQDWLKEPVEARYARLIIEQPTGSNQFFRIFEFKVNGRKAMNIAVGSAVQASTNFYGVVPGNAVDGDEDTYWQTAFGASGPHWFRSDLGETSSVHAVAMHFPSYEIPTDLTLQFSSSRPDLSAGSTGYAAPYEVHVTGNADRNPVVNLDVPVRARYVRLVIEQPAQSGIFFRMSEFEVIGTKP